MSDMPGHDETGRGGVRWDGGGRVRRGGRKYRDSRQGNLAQVSPLHGIGERS